MIEKIQECEALLASAADKGQQIASEGSAADRNSVTEQLQSLKNQLLGLRRAVDAAREQLEQAAAKHKHLAAQLGTALAWLHDHEAQVKSRPLLARDPASVDAELTSHQVRGGARGIPTSLKKNHKTLSFRTELAVTRYGGML